MVLTQLGDSELLRVDNELKLPSLQTLASILVFLAVMIQPHVFNLFHSFKYLLSVLNSTL